MPRRQLRPVPTVDVVLDGSFPGIDEYARRKVTALVRLAHEPVLSARVRISRRRSTAGPVDAQVTLDLRGRPVHLSVSAATARESVDLLASKLRTTLEHRAHGHGPRPDHGAGTPRPSAHAPAVTPEPEETGGLVTHLSHAAPRMAFEDGAAELERGGHEFLLFTSAETGQDVVLHRTAHGGHEIARPVARLTAREAVRRLDALDLPFVFFVDAETGRGEVVHRRHDGRYGLVLPPA